MSNLANIGHQCCSHCNVLTHSKLLVVNILPLGDIVSLTIKLPVCSNRELDAGLQEAVSTLIWAAPRLQSDVAELKVVSTVWMQQSGDNIINVSCPCISFGRVLTLFLLNASFRYQISCAQNIARSMASCAGQTRLAPSMTGYFLLFTSLFKNK